MIKKSQIAALVLGVSTIGAGLGTTTPAEAARLCIGTLTISAGEQITATRDNKYRRDGKCFSILECHNGVLKQSGARLFTCKDSDDVACTYDTYLAGKCSYKSYKDSQTAENKVSRDTVCDGQLVIKVGQGFKTDEKGQFNHADKCYATFSCSNGVIKRTGGNAYGCYSQAAIQQAAAQKQGLKKPVASSKAAAKNSPRAPICRYVDYADGKCTYEQYVEDHEKASK